MTVVNSASHSEQQGLSKQLRALTHETHEQLDNSIMQAASFASVDGYAGFVAVQFLFHRDVDALYGDARLRELLPDLDGRRRLAQIAADLSDLGRAEPGGNPAPAFTVGEDVDLPTALGWLYVAEGSKMGGALLRKEAAKLGLSDSHGARHLAPAPEGPAAHWRSFTAALDAVPLDEDGVAKAVAGANAAFAQVQGYVQTVLG